MRCGNAGCSREATRTFKIMSPSPGSDFVAFSCEGCKRYLGNEELPAAAISLEVEGIGADMEWAIAMSVMEDFEILEEWSPGLRSTHHQRY